MLSSFPRTLQEYGPEFLNSQEIPEMSKRSTGNVTQCTQQLMRFPKQIILSLFTKKDMVI